MAKWFNDAQPGWMELRGKMMRLLQEEAELDEIVKLVGMDALGAGDRLKMEAARSIREDFLHQNSFHEIDTYTPLEKQRCLMQLVVDYYEKCDAALARGAKVEELLSLPVRESIGRYKYTENDEIQSAFEKTEAELDSQIYAVLERKGAF